MAIARKFGDKVYMWNVPDLLARAVNLPVHETSVDRFNLDVDAWFGEAGKPTIRHVLHHMRVIRDANLEEPILLSSEGHVFDGLHRISKCVIEGVAIIKYRQFEVNPEPFKVVDFKEFSRQKPLIAETLVWMERNQL